MDTINPSNTYRGLTFSQWKALLSLAEILSTVSAYLDNPVLLYRANALGMKVRARYHG